MRLVLVNPHYYIYGKTVINILLRRKHFMKYDYFIDYYLKDKSKQTAIYIDGTKTSLAAIKVRFLFFPKFFSYLELLVWMISNGLNPFKVKVYFEIGQLDPQKDVMIDFVRSLKLSELKYTGYTKFSGLVLFFCTHYFLRIREVVEYLKQVPHYLLIAEHNLAQEAFFHNFFPNVAEVYQLPYAFGERFNQKKNFEERTNKCLALGSVAPIERNNKEFFDFFHIEVLQPMRQLLLDKASQYTPEIDTVIRRFENSSFLQTGVPDENWVNRMIRRWAPPFIMKIVFSYPHNKYYQFDIVQKYNQYRMFISGEEIVGLPPINAFEGMACGAAYIGIDHPMYTRIGLIPGVNYVGYKEGDLDDLISKVRYYQTHPVELKKIAEAGKVFVRDHFNRKKIAETFWKDIETISKEFSESQSLNIVCSFRKP